MRVMQRKPFLALVLAVALAPGAAAQSRPRDAALSGLSDAVRQIAERADPAVVQILTRGYEVTPEAGTAAIQSQRGSGAGVIVDPAGYIVTNAHVVGTAQVIQLLLARPAAGRADGGFEAQQIPAQVVGLDRETDIAVLKADLQGAVALRFADSDKLRQGELVFALGSPFGLSNSLSMGVVSSVARELRADDPTVFIQTDAAINPGNSGGPLLNIDGEIVGLNTMIATRSGGSDGVGFALPGNVVRNVYEQIRKNGRVSRGQIGVIAQTVTFEIAEALGLRERSGAILADVVPGGSAEAAGLRVGDVVVGASGKPIRNARQLGIEIYSHARETLTLEVMRAGKPQTIGVAVLERPRDPDRILSLVTRPQSLVPALALMAVDLEKALALMPGTRKLAGVVVAGTTAPPSGHESALRAGDIIYAVNQTAVSNVAQLKEAMARFTHGQTVVLQIERLGQLQYLPVEVE